MYDYGYIAALFLCKDTFFFQKLVKKILLPTDFYSLKGDVTHKLHLTMFYGILENNLDKNQMDKYIKSIKLKTVKLGGLKLMQGYQDFQVLHVEVLDEAGDLEQIHKSLKLFPFDPSTQPLRFIPHIALAYVKPTFKLRDDINIRIPKELKIKKIKYFGIQGS